MICYEPYNSLYSIIYGHLMLTQTQDGGPHTVFSRKCLGVPLHLIHGLIHTKTGEIWIIHKSLLVHVKEVCKDGGTIHNDSSSQYGGP